MLIDTEAGLVTVDQLRQWLENQIDCTIIHAWAGYRPLTKEELKVINKQHQRAAVALKKFIKELTPLQVKAFQADPNGWKPAEEIL